MNITNKQFRLLLSAFIILFLINLIGLFFLIRPANVNAIRNLEKIQLRIDSMDQRLVTSRAQLDSVLININKSLELSRQLDEQVIEISTGYQKDKAIARKQLQILKKRIEQENIKLQSLQNELKKL